MEIRNRTIALLIDSENISQDYFTILLGELNNFGDVTYRRIYGDFTKTTASGWRPLLLEFAIEPMQQYSYVTGKNSTDSAMIIDAMDILYKGTVNCICLATSDSDFTKLATRFRNENYVVIGAGEEKTPQAFRAACHRFLLMDVLAKSKDKKTKATETPIHKQTGSEAENKPITSNQLIELAKTIIHNSAESDGYMHLSAFMNELYAKENAFNPKNYGHPSSKPSSFFKDLEIDGKKIFLIERERNIDRIKMNQ